MFSKVSFDLLKNTFFSVGLKYLPVFTIELFGCSLCFVKFLIQGFDGGSDFLDLN